MGTRESREALVRAMDSARDEARRIAALDAIGQVKVARADSLDLVDRLIRGLTEPGRTAAEVNAFASALQRDTGVQNGKDPAAWARYRDALEKELGR